MPRAERAAIQALFSRDVGHRAAVLSAASVVLLAAGCSAPPRGPLAHAPLTEPEGTPDTGLNALIARQAQDLRELAAAGQLTPPATEPGPASHLASDPVPPRPAAGRTDDPTTPQPDDAMLRALSLAGGGPGLADPVEPTLPEADPPLLEPEPPPPTRSARIAALAGELAGLLKEEAGQAEDPGRAVIAASLLEAVAGGVVPEIDTPGAGPLMLTEPERDAALAVRELAVRLVGDDSEPAGDPHRLREVLLSTAETLREHARVRIAAAELCSVAPAFGSYIPLPRRTFLAGRTARVVVYAEVEHFALRPATTGEAETDGDTVAADLTQDLELYLREGDPQPTWRRSIPWLPRTSRRSFRDLFVATAVDLPASLSVGEYDLKVRITDDVSGARDEAIIPIRIVADASALDQGPTRSEGPAEPPRSGGILPSFAARTFAEPAAE
jgi:hypothetical protein